MTPGELARVMQATWPAASERTLGPVTLRDGKGGGKRVSAATMDGPFADADILTAEQAMAAMGQRPLFLVRPGDELLEAELVRRDYAVVDPVLAYAAPAAALADPAPPPLAAFPHWPPLAIVQDIWAEAGIGPARLAVMHRAAGPKAAILGRTADHPAGAAFVALAGDTAMLHALEVRPAARRQGSAHNILRAAARWTLDQGGTTLSLVVTVANAPARALYASLGFRIVGQYHYRQK